MSIALNGVSQHGGLWCHVDISGDATLSYLPLTAAPWWYQERLVVKALDWNMKSLFSSRELHWHPMWLWTKIT